MKRAQYIILLTAMMTLSHPIFLSDTIMAEEKSYSIQSSSKRSYVWLKGMMVPNGTVSQPHELRRGMILSYKVPRRDKSYRFLSDKSFLYDNAVSAIAFVMKEDFVHAAEILNSVIDNFDKEGKLYFSYSTKTAWPMGKDTHGAVIRTGAAAWFVYGLTYFCEAAKKTDPHRERFIKAAEKIISWLDGYYVTGYSPMKYLYRGGENWYTFKKEPSGITKEVFHKGAIKWASTEHNVDIYFALSALHRLTGKDLYRRRAEKISHLLIHDVWNKEKVQFNQGIRIEGVDRSMALDCSSWGSAILYSQEEYEKYSSALGRIEFYRTSDHGYRGYRPYLEVYSMDKESVQIDWLSIEMVWPEGSLGVAAALLKDNNSVYRKRAKNILLDMTRMMDSRGGIPYASRVVENHFTTYPATVSAAWFIIAETLYHDKRHRMLFWK